MKQQTQKILAWIARKILAKYKPKIIGITGSVGKTSTKEAIFFVVSQTFRTRRSLRNYNNEFGLPLTIIGLESPGQNFAGWLRVIIKGVSLILFKHRYPEVLILEMGIDRPGDMDYLLSIAQPDIAVITSIGISHYEFFPDGAGIETEKGKLAEGLHEGGVLIVNVDNETASRQRSKTAQKVLTYSTQLPADILISNVQETLQDKFATKFAVKTPTHQFNSAINAVGSIHLSALASAIAVAEALHIDPNSLQKGIAQYKPAPGRLNIISGIKHTVIIDDTYNAAPDSMLQALALLDRLPGEIKMAVLGDMAELGTKSDESHEMIGQKVASMKLSRLVAVGPNGKIIARAAMTAGMASDKVISFDNSNEARKPVQDLLQAGSAVLIKGSQAVRMEKITKEIMAEPMRSGELLCRQYGHWLEN